MICLRLCNDFSESCLCFQRIEIEKVFVSEEEDRMDSCQSWLCFCLGNHLGSSAKAIRKASMRLTEEPFGGLQESGVMRSVPCVDDFDEIPHRGRERR